MSRDSSPYGDPPPCRDDCIRQCWQSGCACREKAGPFVPNRIPSETKATSP